MTNREIKFRLRLKAKEDFGTKKKGEILTMTASVFDEKNGLAFWSIDKVWEFLSADEYIGLKDVNGKEIYTSDIVKWGHRKNSEESWHRYAVVEINPNLQLKVIYYKVAETGEIKPTDNHIFDWGRFSYGGSDLEIIGNIYENATLLNK